MNRHRADDDSEKEPKPSPTPRPIVFVFAAGFVIAMVFNMIRPDGSDTVTIFLGSAALLILGVDVGKLTGRR